MNNVKLDIKETPKSAICEFMGIDIKDYNALKEQLNNIGNSILEKFETVEKNKLYRNIYHDIFFNVNNRDLTFISEKCINRYAIFNHSSNRVEKSEDLVYAMALFHEIFVNLMCNCSVLWYLEYEYEDDAILLENETKILRLFQKLGNFYLENTKDIYESLYIEQSKLPANNREKNYVKKQNNSQAQ